MSGVRSLLELCVTGLKVPRITKVGICTWSLLKPASYFRQFDRQSPSVMTFSQAEYDLYLKEEGWSKEETVYLFDLLREYDLRFIIVADRYSYQPRSIEDIKDRYYTVCRRLVRSRAAADPTAQAQLVQAYIFDKSMCICVMPADQSPRDASKAIRVRTLSPRCRRDCRRGNPVY